MGAIPISRFRSTNSDLLLFPFDFFDLPPRPPRHLRARALPGLPRRFDLQFRSTNSTSSSSPSPSTSTSLHGRLGTSALELSRGCRGGRGAGLVLIENVLASPEEFIEWVRWRSPLPRAVARIYWLGPSSETPNESSSNPAASASAALATFSASTSSELALKILSRFPKPPPESTPVRIMALPKTLEISLIDALADEGWPLRTRAGDSEQGLFLVAAALDGLEENAERTRHDPPLPSPRYRGALVRASAVLADTTEQKCKGGRTCRAEWKLSEALAGLSWAGGSGSGSGGEGEGGEGRGGETKLGPSTSAPPPAAGPATSPFR